MKTSLPRVLIVIGIPIVLVASALAARLIWEQTVWSWDRGPQMVGFSLMHSGFGGLLLLALYGGLLWVLAVLIGMVAKRSFGGTWIVGLMLGYGLAFVAIAAPYGFWQRLFVDKYSPQRAAEFFTLAAAQGDVRTVKAFLTHGIDINAQGRYGTALHGATVENKLEIIEFLIAHGANVNALNIYGDTPLGYATETMPETRALLLRHGGIAIRGSEQERERIIDEQVRRHIEEMDRLRADP